MSEKGSESMKKFRLMTAFVVICSLMLTFAQASSPISPKIVFGADPDSDLDAGPTDAEHIEYDGSSDENWYEAIEGFFSIKSLEETTASSLPLTGSDSEEIRTVFIEDTTFAALRDFVELHAPDAEFTYNNGTVTVAYENTYMEFHEGAIYYYVNGRVLPLDRVCFETDGTFYVPIRALALIYSYNVAWSEPEQTVTLSPNGEELLTGEEFYNYDEYMLMARLINAESGNQPLKGKIAVGNVIMNRVADPRFPSTISGVIYDRSCGIQFTTAYNGSLNKKPNEESLLAAKLCLEGYSVTDSCLYFLNPRISGGSWVTRNRPYVMTIADHAFYS